MVPPWRSVSKCTAVGQQARGDREPARGRMNEAGRRQIWFDGPDDAYLVAAALRRHLHATVVADVILVPTRRGPGIQVSAAAASDRLLVSLVRRFGGHMDPEPVGERKDETVTA